MEEPLRSPEKGKKLRGSARGCDRRKEADFQRFWPGCGQKEIRFGKNRGKRQKPRLEVTEAQLSRVSLKGVLESLGTSVGSGCNVKWFAKKRAVK